ncbi:hypothetical protein MMC10_006943 [Thelotrema lepadinum]|nr:hypothetical protein [Thelotrema lepadinum]
MDASLLSSLTTLESALTSLTDSLTSYTPSPSAAKSLLAADATLSHHLTRLATHQQNHAHIQYLRSISDQLDLQFKEAMLKLAELRREIVAMPVTLPAEAGEGIRAVSPQTLLAFARNTSRYTAPAGYKPPSVLRADAEAEAAALQASTNPVTVPEIHTTAPTMETDPSQQQPSTQQSTQSPFPPNVSQITISPSPHSPPADTQSIQPQPSYPPPKEPAQANKPPNPGLNQLSPEDLMHLDPLAAMPYTPWPGEEMVARSSLARSQHWAGAVFEEMAVAAEEKEQGQEEGKPVEGGGQGGEGDRMVGVEMGTGTRMGAEQGMVVEGSSSNERREPEGAVKEEKTFRMDDLDSDEDDD